MPNVYCPGIVFSKRPDKTEFQSCIEDQKEEEEEVIRENAAREDAMLVMGLSNGFKRSRFIYEKDDGLGAEKRGPGRGKAGKVFHTHYGWVDEADVLQ